MAKRTWNCPCCGGQCNTKHPCRRKLCLLGAEGKDMTMEPDMGFDEIGAELGTTGERVRQIYDVAMAKVAYRLCLEYGREMDMLERVGIAS